MVNTSKFVPYKAPWDGEDAPDSRATSEDTGEVVGSADGSEVGASVIITHDDGDRKSEDRAE